MATTTDSGIDTVEISTSDGQTTGPIPYEEFGDRMDEAVERLQSKQLSFDLGAGRRDAPDFASLKITGDFGLVADLKRRQNITVTVSDDRTGEVIATRSATVTSIAFKDKTDQHGITTTERIHTASLD